MPEEKMFTPREEEIMCAVREVLSSTAIRVLAVLKDAKEGLILPEIHERVFRSGCIYEKNVISFNVGNLTHQGFVKEGRYQIIESPKADGRGKAAKAYHITAEGRKLIEGVLVWLNRPIEE